MDTVTVEQLVSILKGRRDRLPHEIGAFVALEACERILDKPAALGLGDVQVDAEGQVSVQPKGHDASGADAARAVVQLLAHVLVAARSRIPPVLLELVETGPSDGQWDLGRLRDDLEASLVPLNRKAARRVLSRMLREAQRSGAPRPGYVEPQPADHEVDADLDALVGPPDGAEPPPRSPATAANRAAPAPPGPAIAPAPMRTAAQPPGGGALPVRTPGPAQGFDLAGIDEYEAPRSRGFLWALLLVVLAAALVGAVALFRPDAVARFFGDETPEARAQARLEAGRAAERERLLAEHGQRYGDLVVSVSPARAQVLLFVGTGPAVARNLPKGVAYEFIAIAEGRVPTRAVVPADATWEETDDGPRYELAMQAGIEAMSFEQLELGATRLPRELAEPSEELGAIRVITNPPGADVYQLIGFAPDVRVRNIRTDETHRLLVFFAGHAPRLVTVEPEAFRDEGGHRLAEIEVVLDPR